MIAWLRWIVVPAPRTRPPLSTEEVRALYQAGLTQEEAYRLLALRWRVQDGAVQR